jgi:hypothetical protein
MSFQIHVNQRTIYNTSCSHAKVAELADAPDLGSGAARRGGSSPPFRTKMSRLNRNEHFMQTA